MTKTPNYGLPQWVADDPIQRTDFNDAFAALENALTNDADSLNSVVQELGRSAVCRVLFGTYTGNGTYGEANAITLDCAFYPLAVFVYPEGASSFDCAMRGYTALYHTANSRNNTLRWTDNSVSWYFGNSDAYFSPAANQFNSEGTKYHYLILGYQR